MTPPRADGPARMRAIVCRRWGEPEGLTLEEVPPPVPGPGDILIGVRRAAVNYADTIMVRGAYQTKPDLPFSPGIEAVGEVLARGEAVAGFAPGDRVMALVWHGGFAEQVVANPVETFKLPDGMDMDSAAALLGAHVSSHVALRWQGRLEAGETLLVLGAGGGVGRAAVEIGKAMGARVIAAASADERLALARAHGADETVNYAAGDLRDAVAALTDGRGVDVCFDPVGGPLFDRALSSLAWGGRILLIGFVGGIQRIPANRLLVKHRSALGSSLRYFRNQRPDLLRRSVEALCAWYAEGRVRPGVTAVYPLAEVPAVMRALIDRRVVGRVIAAVDDGDRRAERDHGAASNVIC